MKNIKFLLFLSVILTGAFSAFKAPQSTPYQIGDEVADFSLKSTENKMISLASYPAAKGVILIFTCNHCPYSIAYEDRIIALHNEFAPKGYPVLAINPNDPSVEPDDSFEGMVKRAAEKKFPFAYVMDEGQKVFPLFGATRTPHVFIVSRKDGKNTLEYIGAIDNNSKDASKATEHYVKDAVNSLLNGKKPEPGFTKAIGCTIKVKGK